MKKILSIIIISMMLGSFLYTQKLETSTITSYISSPKNIHFYLNDAEGEKILNFNNLKNMLEKKNNTLLFAMNGGMYLKDHSPQGLFIEKGKLVKEVEKTENAYGNFYMQPNGIFYITKQKKAVIVTTKDFIYNKNINYATQSGPMLIINGKRHHRFMPKSKNVHIRNGVGILPNGNLLFAISDKKINFYDFATFFQDKGCRNALYLDGFVSRIYLPDKGLEQYDSAFGVMIGESKEER